jgi:hypothetical protein
MHELLTLGITFAVLFTTTVLRSTQNKNVAGGHGWLAFVVGTLMCACELTVYKLVSDTDNYWLIGLSALGAGSGWVAGMLIHDLMMRRRMETEKLLKKKKRNSRIRELSREEIDDRLRELGLLG